MSRFKKAIEGMLKRSLPDEVDEDNLDLWEDDGPTIPNVYASRMLGKTLGALNTDERKQRYEGIADQIKTTTTEAPVDYYEVIPEPVPEKINKEQQELNEKIEKGFRKLKL